MLKKAMLLVLSVFYKIKFSIRYGKQFQMAWINSIRDKFFVELKKGSTVNIGKFLMSRGPLYIKCVENASVSIGNNCFCNHNCSITAAERVVIGDNCMFANNLVIVDHDHVYGEDAVAQELITSPVTIGDNVWVGANVSILKGVTIGSGAVVAAGSVVNRSIPSHEVWGGVPAKKIR